MVPAGLEIDPQADDDKQCGGNHGEKDGVPRRASVIDHAHDIEQGNGTLDDFRRASVKLQVIEDKVGALTGSEKAMEKIKDTGIVSSSTVAANILPGMNPFSADNQTVAVLTKFRRKVFALLFLQNVLVLACALGIELVFQALQESGTRFGLKMTFYSWFAAVLALAVLAFTRKYAPWNYVALFVFNLFGALALASLKFVFDRFDADVKAPHLVCFGIHTLGIGILGVLSSKVFNGEGRRTCKVFVLTPTAIVVTDAIIVCLCSSLAIAPVGVSLGFALLNTLGLLWIGFHIDKLSSLLTVDEYMQPVIVLWCEILITILLFMVVALLMFGGGEGNNDTGACDCCKCTFFYGGTLDSFFIHDDERERRERRRETELAHRAAQQLSVGAEAAHGGIKDNLYVADGASGTTSQAITIMSEDNSASHKVEEFTPEQKVMNVEIMI